MKERSDDSFNSDRNSPSYISAFNAEDDAKAQNNNEIVEEDSIVT